MRLGYSFSLCMYWGFRMGCRELVGFWGFGFLGVYEFWISFRGFFVIVSCSRCIVYGVVWFVFCFVV